MRRSRICHFGLLIILGWFTLRNSSPGRSSENQVPSVRPGAPVRASPFVRMHPSLHQACPRCQERRPGLQSAQPPSPVHCAFPGSLLADSTPNITFCPELKEVWKAMASYCFWVSPLIQGAYVLLNCNVFLLLICLVLICLLVQPEELEGSSLPPRHLCSA